MVIVQTTVHMVEQIRIYDFCIDRQAVPAPIKLHPVPNVTISAISNDSDVLDY